MKKLGILTWHYYPNFGSALQSWALQQSLKNLGYRVDVINYRNPKYGKLDKKACLKYFLHCIFGRIPLKICQRFKYPFLHFQKSYLNETKAFTNPHKLIAIARRYQAVVYGSDQIWAPNVFNEIYMGGHLPKQANPRRISYAASLGLPYIPTDLQNTYHHLLHQFHAVSVREHTGKLLLENHCNIHAEVVLDPTLLIPIEKYRQLEKKVLDIPQKYIFCYFLNKEHTYRDKVTAYAKEKKIELVGISAKSDDKDWILMPEKIGPQEFLWLISNAQAVITDSYHGSIFALLYHKPIFCLERFLTDDPICQNSRIWQLDKYFNIAALIIKHEANLIDTAYDYETFEEKLNLYKEQSLHFLTKALL